MHCFSVGDGGGDVCLYDAEQRRLLESIHLQSGRLSKPSPVTALRCTADGAFLVSVCGRFLNVLDWATAKLVFQGTDIRT